MGKKDLRGRAKQILFQIAWTNKRTSIVLEIYDVISALLAKNLRLEKRLSWCCEERDHFVRVINEAIRICTVGDETIAELKAKNEEWEASFKLYDDAMRRGTKIWQDATGHTTIWPDAAKLIAWLLQRVDQLVEDLAEYKEGIEIERQWKGEAYQQNQQLRVERDKVLGLFGDYEFSPTVDQCVKIWNDLMKERRQLGEDLALHKKIRSAQANMITNLIKKDDQRFSDLQDEHLILHQENEKLGAELAKRNATLDQIDALTKIVEVKVENLQRNTNLVIEQKEKLQTKNENLRETLIQREMIWGGWTRQVAEMVVNILTYEVEYE